jgi:hypothetical protein
MAHFYGILKGGRGEVTRTGHKTTGLETTAASHEGCVKVELWHDEDGFDLVRVDLQPWCGKGVTRRLYCGRIDGKDQK